MKPTEVTTHAPHLTRKKMGLGDAVALVAKPIAKAIDRVAKTNLQRCGGCQRRQETLNAAVPSIPFFGDKDREPNK